ncbi:hypothetical protein CM19_10860 [Candidatus Acidianus copahuensis]|uniref:Uncharacterized protein n=1 Tax=Candidatus Acidianus copahuensis TaxID=1160895 RepID=A0A031LKA2_9CREN|nr:hypothetical protein [Candidatus Acidianus copahuensis]EZQ01976.1 hypothetical protein CM19_10860 [Candidatus Acidianus copahuensis]
MVEKEETIIEPETKLPIEYFIEKRNGKLVYRPPSPFTPPILVIAVCIFIKRKGMDVVVDDTYYLAKEINKRLHS